MFLTYPADAGLDESLDRIARGEPDIDFTSPDGVQHTSWTLVSESDTQFIKSRFDSIPNLYIADGHHRSAAASRVAKRRSSRGSSDLFLTVLFPHDRVQILAYNRAVRDLNGRSPEVFLGALGQAFDIEDSGLAKPNGKHEICLYWRAGGVRCGPRPVRSIRTIRSSNLMSVFYRITPWGRCWASMIRAAANVSPSSAASGDGRIG